MLACLSDPLTVNASFSVILPLEYHRRPWGKSWGRLGNRRRGQGDALRSSGGAPGDFPQAEMLGRVLGGTHDALEDSQQSHDIRASARWAPAFGGAGKFLFSPSIALGWPEGQKAWRLAGGFRQPMATGPRMSCKGSVGASATTRLSVRRGATCYGCRGEPRPMGMNVHSLVARWSTNVFGRIARPIRRAGARAGAWALPGRMGCLRARYARRGHRDRRSQEGALCSLLCRRDRRIDGPSRFEFRYSPARFAYFSAAARGPGERIAGKCAPEWSCRVTNSIRGMARAS